MEERFDFEVTKQTKKKAIWRRVFKEKKWRPLLFTGSGFILLSFAGFAFSFLIDPHNYFLVDTLIFTVSTFLIVGVILLSLVGNFTRRHIKDRLNESLYVKNGKLHHVSFYSVSGGYLQNVAGDRASEIVIDPKTIKTAKYDPVSGRMEIGGVQKLIIYSDYHAGKIKEEHMLNIYEEKNLRVFYDYYNPGLYEYLEALGVKFKKETISFSAFDRRP